MEIWAIVLVIISSLLLNLAIAGFGGMIAEKKGYGFLRGFVIAFSGSFMGLIMLMILDDMSGKEVLAPSKGMIGRNEREQNNIAKGVSKALEEQNKNNKVK